MGPGERDRIARCRDHIPPAPSGQNSPRPPPREQIEHTTDGYLPTQGGSKSAACDPEGINAMYARFKVVGLGLIVAGLVFVGVGGYTYMKTQEGATALQAFSAAQAVELSYNDEGQLVDRGETDGAAAIMGLLTDDWGYAVNNGRAQPERPGRQHGVRVHVPDGHHRLSHAQRHADRRPRRAGHDGRRHGLRRGTLRVPGRRPLLERSSTAPTRSKARPASRPGPARPTRSSPSSVSAA